MYCPRLNHFVRLNPNGTVSRCGHMVDAPEFNSLEEMDESLWLRNVKLYMHKGLWPKWCERCKQTEQENNTSIRLNAIKFDKLQTKKDYLSVGGVLDNVCNSACLTCNEQLSTMIGGLKSKEYPIVDNSNKFWNLPLDRVVHLDINGGEPSASKNYKNILANLPPDIKSVRVNTNCALILDELGDLVKRGVHVTVTVSLDGIGPVYEYVRWPVKWDKFYNNLMKYTEMPIKLNLWTTVSALNVDDLPNIIAFAKEHNIDHSYRLRVHF
jgi:molybdenum cofactor biosynthesis enzyme MoaA